MSGNIADQSTTLLAPSVVEQEGHWESNGEEIDTSENTCISRKVSLEKRLEQAEQRRQVCAVCFECHAKPRNRARERKLEGDEGREPYFGGFRQVFSILSTGYTSFL